MAIIQHVVRLSNSRMTLSRLIIRSTTCLENLNAIPVRESDTRSVKNSSKKRSDKTKFVYYTLEPISYLAEDEDNFSDT